MSCLSVLRGDIQVWERVGAVKLLIGTQKTKQMKRNLKKQQENKHLYYQVKPDLWQ